MKGIRLLTSVLFCIALCAVCVGAISPTLKYSNAETFKSWCEESYYCSPQICDIDGDGNVEIVYASYGVTVLDGKTGAVKWRVNSGHDVSDAFVEIGGNSGHTWSDVEICDIDGDGKLEIISGDSGGSLSVLDYSGHFKKGFPVSINSSPIRSVCVYDLDGNGKSEIIAGLGIAGGMSVYVYSSDGALLDGWPQLDSRQNAQYNASDWQNNGWGYGIFGDGISAGDINGDGKTEIVVPTDLGFLSVYTPDGKLVKANSGVYGNRTWAKIPFYEDPMTELRLENEGWGCNFDGTQKREDLYRMELGHAGTAISDLDGDGKQELVVTGIMANRKYPVYPPTEYMTLFILNGDRTRYRNTKLGYDWTHIPTDLGAPLVQNDKTVSSKVEQKPVIADVDGDGKKEILFASYNGKLHCFSLDGTEHGAFPYSLTKRSSALYEYSTAPIVYDLDGNGKNEVIFASFYDDTQSFTGVVNGSLYILDSNGKLLSKTSLPPSKEAVFNNGAMAKPTVADVDGDGKVEIVINTIHGCVCVYDV